MYTTLSRPPPSIAATTGNLSKRESRLVAAAGILPATATDRSAGTMVVMASAANNNNGAGAGAGGSVVLSPPLSLPAASKAAAAEAIDNRQRSGNAIQRVLSLFSNVRLGADLSQFQMPPQFNIPKSQLQCYGESICCTNKDLLADCVKAPTPLQRMTSVVAWSVSTLRPLPFGYAPYNPVLGETHHLSRGDHLHVFLEQVSHHPPISALHGTDDRNNVELIWCHYPTSKFYGTSIESKIQGKRTLKLKERGENYIMNSPTLFIRFMPFPAVDWVGDVKIHCPETGLRAHLTYNSCSFFGFQRGGGRYLKGKIVDDSTSNTLCEIEGNWDRIVKAKDTAKGTTTIIYDAKEAISTLQTPTLTLAADAKEVLKTESARIWAEVSKAVMGGDWDAANKAKRTVEESQRELARQRKQGATWAPKHFTLTHSKEDGWTCVPNSHNVPQSPIVFHVPL